MQFGKYKLEQATDESIEDLGWTVFIARKCKERRVQLESVKIKKQMNKCIHLFMQESIPNVILTHEFHPLLWTESSVL